MGHPTWFLMFLLWKFSNREYIRVTVQVHQSSHHLISSQTLQNAPYQGDKAHFVPGGFTTHGLRRCLLRVAARRSLKRHKGQPRGWEHQKKMVDVPIFHAMFDDTRGYKPVFNKNHPIGYPI